MNLFSDAPTATSHLQFSVSGCQTLTDGRHAVGTVDQHGRHVILELGIAVRDPDERVRGQREQVAVRVGPDADGTPRARRPQARLAEVTAVA